MENEIQIPKRNSQKYGVELKQKREQREWLSNLVCSCQNRQFYGTMSVQFKNGDIVLAEQSETFKPPF